MATEYAETSEKYTINYPTPYFCRVITAYVNLTSASLGSDCGRRIIASMAR
jgi:hypothetical protein